MAVKANFFEVNEGTLVAYILNSGYCNGSCRHCYVNKTESRAVKGKRSLEEAVADITSLLKSGVKVALRGTEIIIEPEYIPLLKMTGQNYVLTNGIEIARNPGVLDRLEDAGIESIILPYPFFGSEILGIDANLVEKAIANSIDRFTLILSTIITKKQDLSPEKLDFACKTAIDLGARAIKFVPLIPTNKEMYPLSLNREEGRKILFEISRLKSRYDYEKLIIQTSGNWGLFSYRRSLNPEKFKDRHNDCENACPAGERYFVIDIDNNIYPCLYMMSPENMIGRFEEGMIKVTGKVKSKRDDCIAGEYWRKRHDPP